MVAVTSAERVRPRSVRAEDSVRLSADEMARLWVWLARINDEADSPNDQVEVAATAASVLPARLLRAIHRYRNYGGEHDALLIRNLSPPVPIEPTPTGGDPRQPSTRLVEQCLLGVMWLLGEPYTFASLASGRLVQHVIPRPGHELAQSNMGCESFLDWHVEDGFTADRCDYFGLLCVRGAANTRTLFSAVRNADLDSHTLAKLREPRYVLPPDQAHGAVEHFCDPIPVISGPSTDLEICYDAVYMRPCDHADTEAADALHQLRTALTAAAAGHELRTGDLLIVDNRRVVHARTPFKPRFDGTDRWLMRTMVCASLPTHRRRGSNRTLTI